MVFPQVGHIRFGGTHVELVIDVPLGRFRQVVGGTVLIEHWFRDAFGLGLGASYRPAGFEASP